MTLFGQEHVDKYVETDGEVGHYWNNTTALILTTTGRKSGEERSTPLIYQEDEGRYLVVASKAGADEPPAWFLNLEAKPEVHVQVGADKFTAKARSASTEEKPPLWKKMTGTWPAYDEYQEKTDRDIPVVILERA